MQDDSFVPVEFWFVVRQCFVGIKLEHTAGRIGGPGYFAVLFQFGRFTDINERYFTGLQFFVHLLRGKILNGGLGCFHHIDG